MFRRRIRKKATRLLSALRADSDLVRLIHDPLRGLKGLLKERCIVNCEVGSEFWAGSKGTYILYGKMRSSRDSLLGDHGRLKNFVLNRLPCCDAQGSRIGNPVTKVWRDWSFSPFSPVPIWLDLRSLKCYMQLRRLTSVRDSTMAWVARTLQVSPGLFNRVTH